MSKKTYNSNYLGIVVNSDDPQQRGRVQIFIPHIMPALYKGWNEEGKDIQISCIGDNMANGLTSDVVDRLVKILPWAESASPIMSMSSPGQVRQVSGGVRSVVAGAAATVVGAVATAVAGPIAGTAAGAATRRFFDQSPMSAPVSVNAGSQSSLIEKAKSYNDAGLTWSAGSTSKCGIGTRSIIGAMTDDSYFKNGLGTGGGSQASSLTRGNTYLTQSGYYSSPVSQPTGYATDSSQWQVGDVIVAAGGNAAGDGHIQVWTGTSWTSDFVQGGLGGQSPSYSNQTLYRMNSSGLAKVAASSGTSSNNTPATSTSGEAAAANVHQTATGPLSGANAADPRVRVQTSGGLSSDQKSAAEKALAGDTAIRASGNAVALDMNGSPNSAALEGGAAGGADTNIGSWGFSDGMPNGATDVFVAVPGALVGKPFALRNNNTNPPTTIIAYGMDSTTQSKNSTTWRTDSSGNKTIEMSAGAYTALGNPPYKTNNKIGAYPDGTPDVTIAQITDGSVKELPRGSISRADYNNLIGNPLTEEQKSALAAREFGNATPEQIAYLRAQAKTTGATHIVNNTDRNGATIAKDINNMAKGMFAYPAAGAMVWVFFREGNPLYPVYFAASYSQAEWKSAYRGGPEGPGYKPVAKEGETSSIGSIYNTGVGGFFSQMDHNSSDSSKNTKSFMVFGEDGSNIYFGTGYNQYFSKFDRRDQVEGDRHESTLGFNETWVQGDSNSVVMGDQFVKIGNCTQEAVDAVVRIQQIIKEIQAPLVKSN